MTKAREGHDGCYENPAQITLPVFVESAGLIRSGVSENTLKVYQHASRKLESWLMGRVLNDRLLSESVTGLHQDRKSPASISQVVATVTLTQIALGKWGV